MEFEKDAPIRDADRIIAEAKKLTLQPLHANVTPDAVQDSIIASRHILEPAISNVSNDIEQSMSHILPSQSLIDTQAKKAPHPHRLVIGVTLCSIIFVGLTIFAILK